MDNFLHVSAPYGGVATVAVRMDTVKKFAEKLRAAVADLEEDDVRKVEAEKILAKFDEKGFILPLISIPFLTDSCVLEMEAVLKDPKRTKDFMSRLREHAQLLATMKGYSFLYNNTRS